MAEKKEKEVKDKEKKDAKKVEKKETKKETKEKVVEEVDKVEVESPEENKDNKKFIFNIVTIVLIVILLIFGVILVFKKPSPKQAAKDYLSLSTKNPIEAQYKYNISEFDEEVQREKGKYTTYKVLEVTDLVSEDEREKVEVKYTRKGPNSFRIQEEVKEILRQKEIKEGTKKYNTEYLKEFRRILRERKDQLTETTEVLVLIRNPGERKWTINPLGLF